jgi:hypothetical protein
MSLFPESFRKFDLGELLGVPANQSGAFAPLDLATNVSAAAFNAPINVQGFGIYYPREYEPTMALEFDFLGGGKRIMYPGDFIGVPFKTFRVKMPTQAAPDGVAAEALWGVQPPGARITLQILTTPLAFARPQWGGPRADGWMTSYVCAASGPGDSQTINSTGNAPGAAAIGALMTRKKGFRVYVTAESGQTLSGGGSIRLWAAQHDSQWFTGTRYWFVKDTSYLDLSGAAGLRGWMGPDELVSVPNGELYAEAISVTASGGSGILVGVQTWG